MRFVFSGRALPRVSAVDMQPQLCNLSPKEIFRMDHNQKLSRRSVLRGAALLACATLTASMLPSKGSACTTGIPRSDIQRTAAYKVHRPFDYETATGGFGSTAAIPTAHSK
jgi:hypothetical protein